MAAVLLVWCGAAAAEVPRAIEVVPPRCEHEAFPMVPFLDSLRVELAGRGLVCCTLVDPELPSNHTQALRLSVELVPCTPEATTVRLGATDGRQPQASEREISLADVTLSARPRALALAAAELVRSLGQTPDRETSVMPAPAPTVPPPSTRSEEPSMASRMSLQAAGQVRVLPTRSTTLWGGRLRFSLPWRRLYAQIDLGADHASTQTALGRVSLRSLSLGLGGGLRLANRMVIFDLGPRFELGSAWIDGESQAAEVRTGSGRGVSSSLGLRASLEAPSPFRLRPGLAVEGGGVLHGVRGEADGRTVVGITGYYLIGTVALAFSL